MRLIMKRCFKCGNTKTLDEFYAHPQMKDGHLNKCKECTKQDVVSNYADKREQYHTYERERNQMLFRRLALREGHRRHNLRNPDKYRARSAVGRALRDGVLTRQACAFCGSTENVQAHHDDYSKPLDVVWSCFKCHREHLHGQVVTVA